MPANAFAVVSLSGIADLLGALGTAPILEAEARTLAAEIDDGIRRHAIVEHPDHGAILAYEIDGFGSHILMDDATPPSLLSLPALGYLSIDDPLYQRTRAFVLSDSNPWYEHGTAGRGVGSIHIAPGWIWPLSILTAALTAADDTEILGWLATLKATHAGTGLMHESFFKDDPTRFTRPWFAWANSLFGELILALDRERPHLLQRTLPPSTPG